MTNPLKGQVTFTSGDETFTFVLSINAICDLEHYFGKPISDVAARLQGSPRISDLRAIFRAGLSEHHDVTEEDAGRIMTDLGIEKVGKVIGDGFALAFPEAKGKARPQTAPAGTGRTA